eukprot:CAMPEP_0115102184 /NCGR_PEP_ID=MMETSP0227-20121206/33723_1 /TAXON_ID=89957 /ORGANISM="Polarella glacialis, Strain CCMP 1383" /LENGTH=155 /DNA_ID=CAMNT_0002498171 /DNA_START=694 /DNA_END=1157 /DNA_ORIENTATION=+
MGFDYSSTCKPGEDEGASDLRGDLWAAIKYQLQSLRTASAVHGVFLAVLDQFEIRPLTLQHQWLVRDRRPSASLCSRTKRAVLPQDGWKGLFQLPGSWDLGHLPEGLGSEPGHVQVVRPLQRVAPDPSLDRDGVHCLGVQGPPRRAQTLGPAEVG